MKKINYLKSAVLSLATMALLSSCLKDQRYIDFAGSTPLVDFPSAANPSLGVVNVEALTSSSTPTNLPILVGVSSPNPTTTAVAATIAVDAAALTAYNTKNSTTYVLLPTAAYSIANLTVTIPAGQALANLNIVINTTSIPSTGGPYVLPLSIKSVSGAGAITDQYSTIYLKFAIKNQYDGNYAATGWVFHPSAPRAIAATYAVTTIGPITSQVPMADLGGSNYYFQFDVASGNVLNNWLAVGACPPAPASGFMTLDNPSGTDYSTSAPNAPGVAPYTSAIYNNTYDPAGKIFWMHFGYASGGNGQATFTRQFYMKLVRQ